MQQGLLNGGGFLLDPNTFTLYAGKKSYVLPQNEGKILLTLLKSSPNLVSKSDLFHVLWGTAEFIDENALQVNFTRLRKTLREVGLGDRIETVRGQGYRLKERVKYEKLHTLLTYISSNRVWLITLVCLDLFFVFLAWVAYPGDFLNLVGLMIFVSFVALVIPFACAIHRRSKIDTAFRRFLLEPDDTNEYLLCESTPASMHTYIHELAHHLRTQLEYVNEQQLKITDYESYIENWVHEIKKPLSLMTLLLDNRKDEMSPLVHTRMLYVRDHTRQNVEQILYFSRLGAVHKDYYFEPLPILETCKEAVEDNLSLLEEAHFSVTYSGNNCTAISDKKGFMFILGQIISNSVKYAAHDATPAIHFSVSDNKEIGQIVLSICDNGTGIPASDLPFVFDKGFTGDVGSYLSRSTGMGLYLVQQMASDLTIKIDIHSNTNGGTTVILTFPKVERPLGR